MKLIGFKIQSIKSIKDTDWCHLSDHDNITVFAGQNEAGKSAILEGLNFFRNGSNPEFERLSRRSDDTHPYVECEFKLEKEDIQGGPDIINILAKLNTIRLYRGDVTKDDYAEIKISSETAENIEAEIQKLLKISQEEGVKKAVPRKSEPVEEISTGVITDSAAPDPSPEPQWDLEGFKKMICQYLLDHLPEFIYYDSFKGLLPGITTLGKINEIQAVKDFEKVFDIKFEELANLTIQARSAKILEINNSATVDLNEYWSQKFSDDIEDKYQYSINFHLNKTTPDESDVEFMIHRNDGTPLFIEQKSKGFQWFSSFTLRLKSLGVDVKKGQKYLILIDEPGQGLHEKAQTNVKDFLENLQEGGMQIIYTTHNPSLIGVVDQEILRIRLVFQTRSEGTKIKNITQYSSIKGSQDALSPIITAMGINSVNQILDRTVPCVVLEGITDHYYLTAIKKILSIAENYSFIPAVGVPNIRPLVSILIGWGANFKAVFDDGAGEKIYNNFSKFLYPDDPDSLKKHIMKLDGFEGIEDLFSVTDFDKYVMGTRRKVRTIKNSAIAKTKNKELIARLFLEKVSTVPKNVLLSNETKQNFQKIFTWLKKSA